MTFVWDEVDGDLQWSPYGEYPVLTTCVQKKGEYYWDETGEQGTHLLSVTKDGFATGSQLRAYAQDGLDQCKAADLIQGGTAAAERLRPGSWICRLDWKAAGHPVRRELRV